jgi:hypothetical protein
MRNKPSKCCDCSTASKNIRCCIAWCVPRRAWAHLAASADGSADRVVECIERRRLPPGGGFVDALARAPSNTAAAAAAAAASAAVVAAIGICTLGPDLYDSSASAGTALDRRGGVERRREAFMDAAISWMLEGLSWMQLFHGCWKAFHGCSYAIACCMGYCIVK